LFLNFAVNFALETQKNFRLKLASGSAVEASVKFPRPTERFRL
jgi:hypothetical protein